MHRGFLARCQPVDGGHGLPTPPAHRKMRRDYERREVQAAQRPWRCQVPQARQSLQLSA
ncbi:hypothetical protein [Kitasatospora acidiphila]|uniref:hypothetical protein n=1 Tax=Kitasatospora acidiphila TaxID=2567942 RepID=UPI001E32CFB7|nr:hypothetical protein [Kitasatospora acidiphila]